MKQLSFIPFYISRDSFWHRLQLIPKFMLLMFYAGIIFTSGDPLLLLALCILTAIITLGSKLSLRNWGIVLIMILLLAWITIVPTVTTAVVRIIIAFGKIVCLMTMVALFTMTTKPGALLQILRPSNPFWSTLQPVTYILTTTLAVLPSIQYDLQRAIDAETIRRGRKVQLYSVNSWTIILTVLLVRVLTRAERLADTVIDRGYHSEKGLQPLTYHPLRWQDAAILFICIIPGILVLILR